MEEDLSLSLELGGCFTKRKRERFSEEKMIVNQREAEKITETKKNSKESLIMQLGLHSVDSETKKESFRDQFSQSKVQENSDESLALSVTSRHSTESSQQEKQSIRYKTNIADSCVATVSDIAAMNEEENSHARKKLRLSREQALLLEENFRKHTTINPKLKVMLAKQLTLQPRQVEVWFQNRRARTKLKQTEIECKYLKHRYQMLIQENIQLKSEVAELRALSTACANASYPFYKHIGVIGALPFCPSNVHKPTGFGNTKSAPGDCNPVTLASLFPKTQF